MEKKQQMPQPDNFIGKLFDKVAFKYDFLNHWLSLGFDFWWRKKLALKIAELKPFALLDVATGSGDMLLAALRCCSSIHTYYGVDISEEMLTLAKKKGLNNVLAAEASDLPFSSSTFDTTTIAFGLRNFQCRLGALKEIFRVLRPGGTLFVLEFSMPKGVIKPFYLFYLVKVIPRIAALVGAPKEAYDYLAQSILEFPPTEAVVDLFKLAGFYPCGSIPMTLGIVTLYWGKKPS